MLHQDFSDLRVLPNFMQEIVIHESADTAAYQPSTGCASLVQLHLQGLKDDTGN